MLLPLRQDGAYLVSSVRGVCFIKLFMNIINSSVNRDFMLVMVNHWHQARARCNDGTSTGQKGFGAERDLRFFKMR